MNIKTFHYKISAAALLLALSVAAIFVVPQPVNALTAKEVCANKINNDCVSKVTESCKNKEEGNKRDDCIKERAGDFKDKEPNLFNPKANNSADECGNTKSGTQVKTRINFGCMGNSGPDNMGPIEDLAYSLVRFLSAGVGIVVIFFIILAGIQYSTSEGNAEKTQDAKNKIRDAMIGLIVYIFAFAIVQYLVPGGVFSGSFVDPNLTTHIIRGIYE